MQGTKPTRKPTTQEPVAGVDESAAVQEPEPEEPLTRKEINRLCGLGYKKADYQSLPVAECRAIIAAKQKKAGSKAQVNSHANKVLGGVPSSLSDEGIAKKQAKGPREGGLRVRVDAYEMRCVNGDYPIDSTQLEIQDAYDKKFGPGVMRVRAINPNLPAIPGPAFQPVYDEDGNQLGEADLKYGVIPEAVYQERYAKPNIARSKRLMGEMEREGDDASDEGAPTGLNPGDPYYAPAFGPGAKIGRAAA